ncbi:hypothetical protein [Cytobacillus oceanisediminis]|uniref:hypothetical protein n=1 Tax=Cytobacillus oceanisediminis TaxID=665099 RepID=UPI001FB1EA89|nr:hypothetical protein [Cytobacillus oceanisediminis]
MSGSTANYVGNKIYEDLIMTRFPETFDERSGSKLNANLIRWTNLKDYNMAEHVNSLQDAIMAIQRMLGEMAQVPAKPVDVNGNPVTDPAQLLSIAKTSTVNDRITALETYDWYSEFDKRYGGPNWKFDKSKTTNPTIQQHRHLGSASAIPGMPEKIVLTEEVQGKLPKANVDLSKTGITGADLLVDPSKDTKISQSLNDKLSSTTGGTVEKDATLTVLGKTNTRWTREFDYTDSLATSVQDGKTLLGRAAESDALYTTDLLNKSLQGMHYGRYVAIVRLSASSLSPGSLVEIASLNASNIILEKTVISGSDFKAPNEYKNFYFIFNNSAGSKLRVRKLTASSKVRLDYAIVEPVHPAVFDR